MIIKKFNKELIHIMILIAKAIFKVKNIHLNNLYRIVKI